MSAAALLAEARATGVTLRLDGGTVKVGGDPSSEFLARLREAKADLIELLRAEVEATPLGYPPGWQGWPDEKRTSPILPDPSTAPLARCRGCRFVAPLSAAQLCGRCISTGAS